MTDEVEPTPPIYADEEDIMACSDISELIHLLQHAGLDKTRIWTSTSNADMVTVYYGKKMIFTASQRSFVWSFFISYGANIDENVPALTKVQPCYCCDRPVADEDAMTVTGISGTVYRYCKDCHRNVIVNFQ